MMWGHFLLQIHSLAKDIADQQEPVTGIYLIPFPETSDSKYFVMATTPKRIYQFVGNVTKGKVPMFQDMFVFYEQPDKGEVMQPLQLDAPSF